MSIPISQQVDLLYKQAFGVTKTDTAANKSPSNEAIASPLLIRGDTQWTQSDQIPGTAAAVANLVQAYTGSSAVECVADNTSTPVGGVYPTWKTSLTYWIPQEFGSTYAVKVYVDTTGAADPTSTGTQIFAAGSGGTGEFYYNYQSGVLNFIGETIPTALTSSDVLYVVAYRYIGLTGVTNLPDGTSIGNLSITDQTVTGSDTNANIILTPNGTGQVVTSGNITASYFYGNGSQLTGIDASGIQNGTSNVRIPDVNGNIELNVDGALIANIDATGIIATGVGTFTGNVSGSNLTSAGVVEVTGNVIGGNLTTVGLVSATGNVAGGNITTAGVVEATGNVIGGNITTVGVVSATGNVSGGNLTTAGAVEATGNGTFGNVAGGNLVSASFFTGTLIDGTSNITITNNGNIDLVSAGNSTAVISGTGLDITGTVDANGVGSFGSVVTAQVTGAGSGNLTLTAGSADDYVEIRPTGTGQVHVGGFKIESLGAPTASTDAATKQYVDDVAQGLAIQAPAIVASTDTYAAMSTGTVTYDNGTAGVGATLTTTVALTAIDGVTLTVGDRIVIKDEAGGDLPNNGIYTYTSSTVLTRATDFDTPTEMAGGDFVFVQQGTDYNDTGWVMTDPVTTVGTSDVTFVQFSGAGSFTAGAGLTLTGTVFSVNTDNLTTDISGGNVVVKTSAQLTTPNIGAATGTSLTATGNVAGGNLTTGGVVSAVGNITGGNVAGTTGTFTDIGGSLTTAAQPNVTSLGTLVDLTVTGNVDGGNINTGGLVDATGNVSGGNLTTAGLVLATGNVTGGNITTAGVVAATGNVSGGNLTTAGNIDTSAGIFNGDGYGISNIAAGNIVGLNLSGISNGTSNVDIATADGNITLSVDGTSNVAVIDATGLTVGGTIKATGTLTAPAFTANTGLFTGDGGGLSNVVGANVTGEVTFAATANAVAGANVSGQVANALVSGTVYTAAQPNITSVGTLTSITSSGDANIAGVVNIGASEISTIGADSVTTTAITSEIIAQFPVAGLNGAEFLVKSIDTPGTKYGVATVLAVTDGTNVDFSIYGQAFLGTTTGALSVAISGANIALSTTPASSNSTVWTTQYRSI